LKELQNVPKENVWLMLKLFQVFTEHMLNIPLPKSQFRFGIMSWQDTEQRHLDERDYVLLTLKDKDGMPEIKNIFLMLILKHMVLKNVIIADSDFLTATKRLKKAIEELEKLNQGYGKTNYRLRMRFLPRDIGRTVPSVLCDCRK
jgi:hypothetical protein